MTNIDNQHFQKSGDAEAPLQCHRCGSHKLYTGLCGISLLTGLVDVTKVLTTCLKCGWRFEPPKQPLISRSTLAVIIIVGGCIILTISGAWL